MSLVCKCSVGPVTAPHSSLAMSRLPATAASSSSASPTGYPPLVTLSRVADALYALTEFVSTPVGAAMRELDAPQEPKRPRGHPSLLAAIAAKAAIPATAADEPFYFLDIRTSYPFVVKDTAGEVAVVLNPTDTTFNRSRLRLAKRPIYTGSQQQVPDMVDALLVQHSTDVTLNIVLTFRTSYGRTKLHCGLDFHQVNPAFFEGCEEHFWPTIGRGTRVIKMFSIQTTCSILSTIKKAKEAYLKSKEFTVQLRRLYDETKER